jgi:hypothetical protein
LVGLSNAFLCKIGREIKEGSFEIEVKDSPLIEKLIGKQEEGKKKVRVSGSLLAERMKGQLQ